MGWGFDIFQNFAVKFPAHGQIIPGKCPKVFAVNGSIISNFSKIQKNSFQNFIVNLTYKVKFIRIIQETRVNFVCLSVVLEPNNFPFFIKDLNFTTP